MDVKNNEFSISNNGLNKILDERHSNALKLQKRKPINRDENNPELSRYIVTEKSVLVSEDGLTCSYCEQGLDSYHKHDCDHICKDVKIRAVIEYTVNVPSIWIEDEVRKYASSKYKSYSFFDNIESEEIIETGEPYFNGLTSIDDNVSCSWCASWRGNYRREKCDHICKDVRMVSVVEYTITVPSSWEKDDVETYADLEGNRMGLFEAFELEKVIEEGQAYFSEDFRTHLL